MGIGGLEKQFTELFRRAFASRVFSPAVIHDLGILLYGPPGTGKTLIARQIGKALNAVEPKIVNGPEILNKFVGQSEENIRNLFRDAEAEQEQKGDQSSLHIIIFDEIDAICKSRGSSPGSAGVNDSIVNQLLSKIDGVNALNNILLIGMTNRRDLIDEALLRPGRLEVHIEIGLPDEEGRLQILNIHTARALESQRLAIDVDLNNLATKTTNFSGAELEGLVRSAASFAFQRNVAPHGNNIKAMDANDVRLTRADFEAALDEVRPAYGTDVGAFHKYLKHELCIFSPLCSEALNVAANLVHQLPQGTSNNVLSSLLCGAHGSGKSTIAAHIAKCAHFSFTKFLTPADYVGYTEYAKVQALVKIFDDANKCPYSLIVLDDIEHWIEYTPIGPRFSNAILQCLLVLVKSPAANDERKLCVVGTTAETEFAQVTLSRGGLFVYSIFGYLKMQECGLADAFSVRIHLPLVSGPQELTAVLEERRKTKQDITVETIQEIIQSGCVQSIPIKPLLLALDMASTRCHQSQIVATEVETCLREVGHDARWPR